VFRAHLRLARAHGLPVLVHCLKAHPTLQRVLAEEPPVPAGLLLHSYSGSAELVPRYARAGCHFSFAGPVSFLEARRPLEALRAVPEALLLAETDAPDQAPHPHRGSRSEPAFLPLIVAAMAAARGVPLEALTATTAANAQRLFRRWG
jgi:TatD DNase family protein